jgi:hypothetical protein
VLRDAARPATCATSTSQAGVHLAFRFQPQVSCNCNPSMVRTWVHLQLVDAAGLRNRKSQRMRAMLIGSVPLKTLLALTGINRETLKSDRLRGYSVAAFGAARSVVNERCLLVDGIAMLIHNDLSGTLHRRAASVVVRGFWDKWAEALARIEHKNEPVLFAIGQSSETVWWAGSGLARELPLFVANQPPMQRLLTVNIARHKCNMEQRAEKLGIGLSTGFILPPDDPRFVSWMAEFRRDRESRQEMFDPLHMKPPHSPSARLRKSVEEAACRLQ